MRVCAGAELEADEPCEPITRMRFIKRVLYLLSQLRHVRLDRANAMPLIVATVEIRRFIVT